MAGNVLFRELDGADWYQEQLRNLKRRVVNPSLQNEVTDTERETGSPPSVESRPIADERATLRDGTESNLLNELGVTDEKEFAAIYRGSKITADSSMRGDSARLQGGVELEL